MSIKNDVIDDNFFDSLDAKTDSVEKEKASPSEEKKIEITTIKVNKFELPSLIGEDYPIEYKRVVDRFLDNYSCLPRLNYDELYKELAQLSVKSDPTPTLQTINLQLQKVQASKDRLAEIFRDVIRCYHFKKRSVNILSDAWGKFAEGTSADKRKFDCAFRLSDFQRDLAETEAFYGACEHVLKNLDSNSNALSRQITIIQSQLKIFDIGRGALPDFDFNKSSFNDAFESVGSPVSGATEKKEISLDTSVEAQECSF